MATQKSPSVRLAIIGTGGMANQHARLFGAIKKCKVIAAVDVDAERASKFAEQYGIPESYGSVTEMLAKSDVDAVSIVTPDAYHAALSIQCLNAGKHVLCEKPLALNHADTVRMVKAAKKSGKINMVNFSYRNWAALQGVAKLVQSGKLGEIRHIEASYHQAWLVSKVWGDWRSSAHWLWRMSTKHGSKGVLGDVGVHILDFASFPAGPVKQLHCKLKTFKKAPRNRIGEYVLDANDSAVITAEFANGALASIQTTRMMGGHPNRLFLKISGTKGSVSIDSDLSTDNYRACLGKDFDTCTWKEIKVKPVPNIHQRFITGILTGKQDQPDFARGAEIQKLLDACVDSDAAGTFVKI